jgi:hypothetical protein
MNTEQDTRPLNHRLLSHASFPPERNYYTVRKHSPCLGRLLFTPSRDGMSYIGLVCVGLFRPPLTCSRDEKVVYCVTTAFTRHASLHAKSKKNITSCVDIHFGIGRPLFIHQEDGYNKQREYYISPGRPIITHSTCRTLINSVNVHFTWNGLLSYTVMEGIQSIARTFTLHQQASFQTRQRNNPVEAGTCTCLSSHTNRQKKLGECVDIYLASAGLSSHTAGEEMAAQFITTSIKPTDLKQASKPSPVAKSTCRENADASTLM